MKVEFTAEAEHELTEASLWYESKEPGLGIRFRTEVQRVVRRASEDPTLWRMREGGYRRVNCPVFPYFIAYIIRRETIVIIAVAHSHRKPDYWVGR